MDTNDTGGTFRAKGVIGLKAYRAIIWMRNNWLGHRVCVLAENAEEAKQKLEARYGEGHVYYLQHDEDEVNRPR